jgi:peroxiredoxin family protein
MIVALKFRYLLEGDKSCQKMMKKKIEQANIPSLADMQEMAQLEGVELVACHMSVQMMEIKEDKLIEGVPEWTAEDFLKYARDCKICLFT